MDKITNKTPNPPNTKCHLYWYLIALTGDTVSHVDIFDPSCELAPL